MCFVAGIKLFLYQILPCRVLFASDISLGRLASQSSIVHLVVEARRVRPRGALVLRKLVVRDCADNCAVDGRQQISSWLWKELSSWRFGPEAPSPLSWVHPFRMTCAAASSWPASLTAL